MQLVNKTYLWFFISLASCQSIAKEEANALEPSPMAIDMIEVPKSALTNIPNKGLVMHQNEPFTGNSVKYYENEQMAERITYVNGKRQGIYNKWYPDGLLSYEASYRSNRTDGTTRSWWPNTNLRSEAQLVRGVISGTQRQWYQSGALFKEMNYKNGKEEGMQRAWRENGKLYTNYEAKNGRTFGLRRSTLCFELEEEDVQFGG